MYECGSLDLQEIQPETENILNFKTGQKIHQKLNFTFIRLSSPPRGSKLTYNRPMGATSHKNSPHFRCTKRGCILPILH
ncbi:uncharacterized protein CANTADRAFT_327639 [Suhomyces tanzawaensis NRRL Y-17324]|uniref:Uncharacterized protein n=1 Tax=Suhomyces tanzawaensis NRRL Y-17324 TaxID=984487 RepID=A0A1E4SCM6_9ASCO|nr:uncharacterized protein CANTADRAFT_327639 [Suhomyces tanzawaensis NRRL Y-17324]ODV77142.1 hypothetical protein CANTADRAFT_327639 [Suhomyces tanzawaensis NRRL Y-17324]